MQIQKNAVVSFIYRILDQQGQVFEQSDLPMDYIHGIDNPMFEKVERCLENKGIGDKVVVELTPEEGFGPYNPKLTFTDKLENVPPEFRHVGARPTLEKEDGETVEFYVSRVENGEVTVDANHPLAGQTVTFHITVTGVRQASDEELRTGIPANTNPNPSSTLQ